MKETIQDEEESQEKEEKGNKNGLEVSSDEEDGADDIEKQIGEEQNDLEQVGVIVKRCFVHAC